MVTDKAQVVFVAMTAIGKEQICACGHDGEKHHRAVRLPCDMYKFKWTCVVGECQCQMIGVREEWR